MKNFRAAKFHKRIRTERLSRKVFSQMLVFYNFGKNKRLNDRFLPTNLNGAHYSFDEIRSSSALLDVFTRQGGRTATFEASLFSSKE